MMKKRMFRLLVVVALIASVTGCYVVAGKLETQRIAGHLPAASQPHPAAPQIDRAQLLSDVRTLSSPEYEGRKTGEPGSLKAQAYLQQRFAELGLQAFGSGYGQQFSFDAKSGKGLLSLVRADKVHVPRAVNMIGYLRGSASPEQVIVISAHYDHVGMQGGVLHPGADDNASGVAALLAAAKHFKANPPQHTIVFAAFDAEEMGLKGAEQFMAKLPFPRSQLMANLNFDMLSRNDLNEIFVAGTHTNPALVPLIKKAAARSMLKVRLGHDRPMWMAGSVDDWSGSSDHGVFADHNVPWLYVGVEDHADYHSPRDTFDKIPADFFVKASAFTTDLADILDRNIDVLK
jgi:Zn-dependent M28 family amino/carboxypeptidase